MLRRTAAVVVGYLAYAVIALSLPTQERPPVVSSGRADAGLRVWLAHNCQACHSLYGLGGHVGPDLTNVTERRPPGYVEAVVRVGLPGMPAFELSDGETADLVAYLSGVSATGVYPPRTVDAPVFGERR